MAMITMIAVMHRFFPPVQHSTLGTGALATNGVEMDDIQISDEYMREHMATTRSYTCVLLKNGPNRLADGADEIVWEHGRRNFLLRAQGLLSIVCPVADDTKLCGIGIFNASRDETVRIMDDDPGVVAGVFVYEVHPVRSFPGDALPA